MPSEEELSPEEKLLKVIQEGPADNTNETGQGRPEPSLHTGPESSDPELTEPTGLDTSSQQAAADQSPDEDSGPADSPTVDRPISIVAPGRGGPAQADDPAEDGGTRSGPEVAAAAPGEAALIGAPPAQADVGTDPEVADTGPPTSTDASDPTGPTQSPESRPDRARRDLFKIANSLVAALCVLLFFGLILEILAQRPSAERAVDKSPLNIGIPIAVVPLGPEDPYIEIPARRNIFTSFTNVANAVEQVIDSELETVKQHIATHLKLLGVSIYPEQPSKTVAVVADSSKKPTQIIYLQHDKSLRINLKSLPSQTVSLPVSGIQADRVILLLCR